MAEQLNPNLSKYDDYAPGWVKGIIGAVAAGILLPASAFVVVVKFGGVEDIMKAYAEQQLIVQKPVVKSNDGLAVQMLELSRSMQQFTNQVNAHAKVLDGRLAATEASMTIHAAQIDMALQTLQKLEGWASEHSKDGTADYGYSPER